MPLSALTTILGSLLVKIRNLLLAGIAALGLAGAAQAGSVSATLGIAIQSVAGLTFTCTTLNADGKTCNVPANAPVGTVVATTQVTQIPPPNPSTWTLVLSNVTGTASQLSVGTGTNSTALVTNVSPLTTAGAGSLTVTANF